MLPVFINRCGAERHVELIPSDFTWPLMMFAGVAPEGLPQRIGKIHVGKPLVTKNRRQLIAFAATELLETPAAR